MFTFSIKHEDVTAVIKDSFFLYKETFTRIVPLAFVLMLATSLTSLRGNMLPPPHQLQQASVTTFAMMVLLILFSAFFVSAILARMYFIGMKKRKGMKQALQLAWKRFWIVAPAMVMVVACILLGALAFLLPGIFIAVLTIFYMPFILFEDATAFASIKLSVKLVWGHWWKTVGAFAVPGLLIIAAQSIIAALIAQHEVVARTVANTLVLTMLIPFFYAVVLVQYNNLKLIKPKKKSSKRK